MSKGKVVEFPTVQRRCVGCGAVFTDVKRGGSGRMYCDRCKPRSRKPAGGLVAKADAKAARLPGVPFELVHFKAWAATLHVFDKRLKKVVPFVLEDWEEGFVADVFAGFKECWLIVPEGNGKSTIVAVLVLYCVQFAEEAKVPVAASARDQANIIFEIGQGIVRRTAGLIGFACKPGLRVIRFNEGYAKIYAGDAGTGDGVIPWPVMVIDELHRHDTLDLYRTWAGKLDKEDAQLIVISTAGEPGSDFEETRESMRANATDVTTSGCYGRYASEVAVLHEYAVPLDGDPEDLALVKAANPSSRITEESLRLKRARPSWAMHHWRRLTCNMATRAEGAGLTAGQWAAALTDERIPEGVPVYAGADFGWVYDTTAIVPLWVRDHRFRLLGAAQVLVPPPDGSQLSVDLVKQAFTDLHERNPLISVTLDMTRAEDVAQWLQDELGVEVVNRGQSNPLAALDYEKFMEGLRGDWLKHTGDPDLRRHVLNAVTRMLPDGKIRFDRPRQARKADPEKQKRRVIDALAAAGMVNTTVAAILGEPEETSEFLVAFG